MRSPSSKSIDMTRASALVLAMLAMLSFPALAASPEIADVKSSAVSSAATAPRLQPSALLTIDQNRTTVVDRIVREWGESLMWSNAGINHVQLREMLMGLRADHLLAASLAGNLDGLRNVLANALSSTAAVAPGLLQTKALGDLTDDLVYTPVTPCRVVDSRYGGGGTLAAGATRNWLATNPGGNFVAQGGSNSDCGIPVKPAAVLVNITVANTGAGPAFLTAWPYNQARPNASTLNWTVANAQIANAVIVPLCVGACADDFSVYVTSASDVIVDVAGYFARPANYHGTHFITGIDATDSGGYGNTASGDDSTVAGGLTNTASGPYSTVGGGCCNMASGAFGTVAGGAQNTASGSDSTVAGGINNVANGGEATVAGGLGNMASGAASTVAGGFLNTASGYYSFAAGSYANADHNQCFVFANWSSFPVSYPSCLGYSNIARFMIDHGLSVDYYSARNDGGGNRWVHMGDLFSGQTIATWTTAYLSDAGVWTNASDVASKADFRSVNARQILAQVVQLPIRSWRYKVENPGTRHVGPVAQDFRAAFGLGDDDKHIGTVDAEGVALAAIQGLHQLVQQKDAKLGRQQREITVLKRKLGAIEAKLGLNY